MSLLKLENIGKIYVSEKNVSVGIREVNLSFDSGEFVCVTGKSGSGKSTLLNVISGMDSYEEGELYALGEPTSHFLQPDWEEYREKYISFIFQDYNIIDSFTVLENVELALMHIEDRAERRRRAMELIDKVGLTSHLKHKGSKLSGGQKQRTVIARALAKDSPIILADEPTGNLDSETSKEIIDLLRRVSKDKLVIVVTHNFEDFEAVATRHIRIHDGFIEFDHEIKEATKTEIQKNEEKPKPNIFKNGIALGMCIFKAKPRLTAFLCILMVIGTLGLFLVTASCGDAADAFKPNYMFSHIDGRLVITTDSGRVMTEDEVKEIATKYGAESYLRYDSLLDVGSVYGIRLESPNSIFGSKNIYCDFTYGEDFGNNILGRYPEATNEVFLYLPISYQVEFGKDSLILDEVNISNLPLKVVGVKYYYDNNIDPKCLLTEDGFRLLTAAQYLERSSVGVSVTITGDDGDKLDEVLMLYSLMPSFDIPSDKIYVGSPRFETILKSGESFKADINLTATYYVYDYFYGTSQQMTFSKNFTEADVTATKPATAFLGYTADMLVVSDEILTDIAYSVLEKSYKQASIFFENDKEAHRVAELLKADGYIAVSSDTTYESSADDAIWIVFEAVATLAVWLLSVVFLAFFINICSLRAIESFKGDMAIMRSMGIKVRDIKVAIYVRMALCLIPALILLALSSVLIFTSTFNQYFSYLYPWQYAVIVIGMAILVLRTTKKQIARLFGESVKKSMKGGDHV